MAPQDFSPTYKQSNLMGLSQYEFENTIEGKMMKKLNHHLDLSKNRTKKINNVNKVWYDKSKDIEKDLLQ